MPEISFEEAITLEVMLKDKTDEQLSNFRMLYLNRRRDSQVILIATAVGFLGFAGIQRFLLNQIGMGLLYLFTMGFCGIGTIIDLINHRNLAMEYNQKIARDIIMLLG